MTTDASVAVLGREYEMLRESLRRFGASLPEQAERVALPTPEAWRSVVVPLALRDLLSDDAAEAPDVDWLAWLVTFEELGSTSIGTSLLAGIGLGAGPLHLLAGRSTKARELRDAALSGDLRVALAIQEPGPLWARGRYAATVDGGGRLWGTKLKVAHASSADVILVVAARDDGTACLAAVDRVADGVSVVDEPSPDVSLSTAAVGLDGARATPLSDATVDDAIGRALCAAKLALAAFCVGSARRALDLAVDYVRQRRQFGRALREFQAVSHRCGRAHVQLEQMRALAYRAALEGAHGDWHALPHSSAVARLFCADALASVVANAMRVQGAIGITWENELSSHYRRAYWLRELLGGRALERRLVLEEAIRLMEAG